MREKFAQPIIEAYPHTQNLANAPDRMIFDFQTCTLKDLQEIDFYFKHQFEKTGVVHGYAMYFDAHFKGTDKHVVLPTGPEAKTTHWYQTRMLL
jgi:hypothetical protein